MASTPYDKGARQWLKIYGISHGSWVRRLREGRLIDRAEAVRQAASGFGIARNFPKSELTGAEKHIRTVEELDRVHPNAFGDDTAGFVLDFEKRLAQRFGSKRMMLSAASKVLWVRYPGRSVIIDNHAARVLGFGAVSRAMYPKYVSTWKSHYATVRQEVIAACRRMLADPGLVRNEDRPLVDEEWFRHRAFDSYLWLTGTP